MKLKRFFPIRERITDQCVDVIVRTIKTIEGNNTKVKTIEGRFYRVFPKCWDEVFLLQCMDQHVDKWAPASGHGVIVTAAALKEVDA